MSWKDDDRNRNKRNNIRTFKKQHYRNISRNNKESSSSPRVQAEPYHNRGIVDIADSSDDRLSFRSNRATWSPINSDDEEMNEQMQAADFEMLQSMSIGNSYTTLSSEKNWEVDINNRGAERTFEKISYFTLNLALVNAGLKTIPFYKRMDYICNMFGKQEIKGMNLEAEFAESKYQTVLNIYELKPGSEKTRMLNSANPTKNSKTLNAENELNDQNINEYKNELNATLNVTEVSKFEMKADDCELKSLQEAEDIKIVQTQEREEKESNTEEIQQWLDQVLDLNT